jgi:hypothetical protein
MKSCDVSLARCILQGAAHYLKESQLLTSDSLFAVLQRLFLLLRGDGYLRLDRSPKQRVYHRSVIMM